MPVGVTLVHWTPENDTKLFLTILAVHDVKIDVAKVAAAFGKFNQKHAFLTLDKQRLPDM